LGLACLGLALAFAAHRVRGGVGAPDEVEVIADDPDVRQRRLDRLAVAVVGVDRDHLDARPDLAGQRDDLQALQALGELAEGLAVGAVTMARLLGGLARVEGRRQRDAVAPAVGLQAAQAAGAACSRASGDRADGHGGSRA
jgi:hypothetical protein